jgi:hypothetical protein
MDPNLIENTSHGEFRHELNHDAESVFWLLLYWAMVVQPEGSFSKERIDAGSLERFERRPRVQTILNQGTLDINVI